MDPRERTAAQQAVDVVAAVMAGRPREEIEVELRHWLGRRDAALTESQHSLVVEAVALGCRAVTLGPVPSGTCDRHPEAGGAGDERTQYLYAVDSQARPGEPGSLRFVRAEPVERRTQVSA